MLFLSLVLIRLKLHRPNLRSGFIPGNAPQPKMTERLMLELGVATYVAHASTAEIAEGHGATTGQVLKTLWPSSSFQAKGKSK